MSIGHAILGVLRKSPMHGYQIAGELERRIGGGRYNGAQVYQALYALEDRGLVVPSMPESRDRRPFSITSKGQREFLRWLRAPIVPSRPSRDDALVKLVFLGREDPGHLMSCLERLRRMHVRRLSGVAKPITPPNDARTDLFMELSAMALRFREEAEIRWIDHCLARLRETADIRVSSAPVSEPGVVESDVEER